MFKKWLNKIEERISKISNRDYIPAAFSFEWVLVGISYVYGLGVRVRIWLYKKNILKPQVLPCSVISVGNIVVGGAGKTPMAVYVALQLKKMGKNPVVVSRGYQGENKTGALIVSDGSRILSDAENSGDEPYMMAKRCSFPVVMGKDRFKAGMKAMNAFNPDVIVLDDGFQHLRLKRDLDLLLLDYERPFGNTRFLPAGRLREPPLLSAQRADVLLFTRSSFENGSGREMKQALQAYPGCPWFKTRHVPFILEWVCHPRDKIGSTPDMEGLKGKNALLISGIANNASFYDAMKESGVNVLGHLEFKDHYRYKESDVLNINKTAKTVSADMIITTEKDWAKLDRHINWDRDLVVIGIQIGFEHPQQFESLLRSRLKINE